MPEIDKKHSPQPINDQPSGLKVISAKKINRRMNKFKVLIAPIIIFIFAIIAIAIIFFAELLPVGGKSGLKKITIASGSNLSDISNQLKSESIIRNSMAFELYVRLINKKNNLQAGTYRLSPTDSTQQIVEHILKGSVDTFNITFYPGGTLTNASIKASDKKYDVTSVLKSAGYTDEEIKLGLSQDYNTPNDKLLFLGKPAGSDLEGYVFGQTYKFNVGASVHEIIQTTLDELYKQITENGFVAKFSSHGLNLFQGITLASIIQKEASDPEAQKQIAQVFYLRLSQGMTLGSDVTYQYIADKTGVPRATDLDSPYNLRIHNGLTPGPISSPSIGALEAVANPASGDYLYFLAGDDKIVHYAKTQVEHESNITKYCQVLCSTP